MSVVFIFGSPETEHLRLERLGNEVQVISHELAPVNGMAQQATWRDRPLASMEFDRLVKAVSELAK